MWHAKQTTDKLTSGTTNVASSPAHAATATTTQQTPQVFVKKVLNSLATNGETQLTSYMTPVFKDFRAGGLATYPCAGKTITNPSVLFCGSLLNPADLIELTPTVTDFTFKDGQKGKSVDYQIQQKSGDTGTTYYTFKLIPQGSGWQLNDYNDFFVSTGSTPPPLLGIRESI